ncbi:hypothetical protein [Streptomyces sp. NBC_00989]|uniref:hypothetical protein n=1 Tax=Streptomyces sp. NBC_00989 TaxID=2903705 RepID=UPI00386D4CA7|nr:hypothetical protein OG714_00275 [Streptomyces sp. NBC_00989]WSW98115.1 hypothetical protein OG714_53865 [Streptomyces sp. NBC_00989]
MKHVESDGRDVPQECGTPSAARKAGFAAVMQRLASRSEAERAVLAAEAEGAVLGYEAYALGQEYLERGNWAKALQWLKVAARHRVPGADGTLAEAQTRQAADRLAPQPPDTATRWTRHGADAAVPAESADTAPTVVCGQNRITAPTTWRDWPPVQVRLVRPDPWAAEQAAARAAAERITTQARREAAELLGRAQQQAEAAMRAAREQVSPTPPAGRLQRYTPLAIRLPADFSLEATELFCTARQVMFRHGLVQMLKLVFSTEEADLRRTQAYAPRPAPKPGAPWRSGHDRIPVPITLGCAVLVSLPTAPSPQKPLPMGQPAPAMALGGGHFGEPAPDLVGQEQFGLVKLRMLSAGVPVVVAACGLVDDPAPDLSPQEHVGLVKLRPMASDGLPVGVTGSTGPAGHGLWTPGSPGLPTGKWAPAPGGTDAERSAGSGRPWQGQTVQDRPPMDEACADSTA